MAGFAFTLAYAGFLALCRSMPPRHLALRMVHASVRLLAHTLAIHRMIRPLIVD